MLKREYEGQNCSIARALEIVGERWTLLIIRDVFLGIRRFDELQESLGVARNVLTDRLNRLVGEGVLERVPYSAPVRRARAGPGTRAEGRLTYSRPATVLGVLPAEWCLGRQGDQE